MSVGSHVYRNKNGNKSLNLERKKHEAFEIDKSN